MFVNEEEVHTSTQSFCGCVDEKFNQCDWANGLGPIMIHLPQVANEVCKVLCMQWVDHHANDKPGAFPISHAKWGQAEIFAKAGATN